MQENAFENVVCEMASILSRPQCVKPAVSYPANIKYTKFSSANNKTLNYLI